MPPWQAEHTTKFIGARYLSDDQLGLLKRWADDGGLEGDVSDLPPLPEFIDGWQLRMPGLVVTMPKPFAVPAEGSDVYRNFVVPLTIPKGKFIKAVEYRPGNRRVVHHAVLSTVSGTARLDDRGDGVDSGLSPVGTLLPGSVGIWAPGKNPLPLPAGFSLEFPADAQLILQLHLHPSGKAEIEQSSIGLHFTDKPPLKSIRSVPILNNQVDIKPGEKNLRITQSYIVPRDMEVIGQFPHMHLLGRTVTVRATEPGGGIRQILAIRDWDFNWQTYYQFAKPLNLPLGTHIDVEWTFDNSEENPRNPSHPPKQVTYGEQTTNEMAVLVLEVVSEQAREITAVPTPLPAKTLRGAEATKIAKLLCREAEKLAYRPLNVTADADMAIGLQGEQRGLMVVLEAGLTAKQINSIEKEVLPLGLLFLHNVSPVAADKALAGSEQAIVELDTPQGKVPLKVLHLGASKVAGRLVLLAYAKESRPTIVAILAELEETQADPLSVDVVRASDKEASLRLTFLGRFRTAIAISGDEPQPCGK